MNENVNGERRRLVGGVAAIVAASQLGIAGRATAMTASSPGIRQIDAGALDVGYMDSGPRNGPPVVLLHGWPLARISDLSRSRSAA